MSWPTLRLQLKGWYQTNQGASFAPDLTDHEQPDAEATRNADPRRQPQQLTLDGMVRELSLAPIHPDPDPSKGPPFDKRCRIRLEKVGDALLLGRLSEAPPGQEFNSGISSMLVHRKHVRIEGEPPVLTALGAQPCIVINSAGRLKLTQGQSCVLSFADTCLPGPPLYVRATRSSLVRAVRAGGLGQLAQSRHACRAELTRASRGLRTVCVPASCVPCVPEAQGSSLPGRHALYVRCAVSAPASGVPWVPRTVAPQVLSELDEIHLIDINLAQQFNLNAFGTGYTGDACAYRVDCAAPFLLQPIAPDGRAYRRPRLQLGSMV